MVEYPVEFIKQYQEETFRFSTNNRISTRSEAVEFVNERGYVFFWPIKGVNLPSLWGAVAGDRPVANAHDDPGHITWRWKDELLGKRVWLYAKLLRKRATLISLDIAPYFYALTENYGSPEEDYLTLYEQGRMTNEAKLVYECILSKGPIDTVAIKRETHLSGKSSDSRFNRALVDLQAELKIVPVGVTESGGWRYSFAYDILPRYLPEIPATARFIPESDARIKILDLYFRSVGAAQMRDVFKLFRWTKNQTEDTVQKLLLMGYLDGVHSLENQPGNWYIHSECVEK